MSEKGKIRFKWELEKFVATRLKYFPELYYSYEYDYNYEYGYRFEYKNGVEERFRIMDKIWEWNEHTNREYLRKLIEFPQLTNHEICHEMFWNAFRGRSKMFIQIQDLRFDDNTFNNKSDEIVEGNVINEEDSKEVITLQCSLLTLQMLDYDIMMFRAMGDAEDEEYRNAAQQHYRPYLFSFVAEIDHNKYQELQKLQRKLVRSKQDQSNKEEEESPYLWIACTFNPNINVPHVNLNGYVVQSASNIDKIKANLSIIEDVNTPVETINSILDGYKIRSSCIKDDDTFIQLIENKLGHKSLSTIDIYKIGNGNCIFAQSDDSNVSFFYDIGFNYRHRPQKISHGVTYNYSNTMKRIVTKKPSFFILSHWDMDHIAGSAAAGKDYFEKDWFAPDCYDACADAKRLAIYLDMKDHLFLAARHPKSGTLPSRLIGKQIDIVSATMPSHILATYKLYMGKKDKCDSSYPNCEGIAIEYADKIKKKVVLMMGDVNYASFNKARATNKELSIADTQIEYLIAPHHGSEHTDYLKVTNSGTIVNMGKQAIICCTNETADNRPNDKHLKELKKRFDDVITTEEVKGSDVSQTITL